jgi:hypothetical protein
MTTSVHKEKPDSNIFAVSKRADFSGVGSAKDNLFSPQGPPSGATSSAIASFQISLSPYSESKVIST